MTIDYQQKLTKDKYSHKEHFVAEEMYDRYMGVAKTIGWKHTDGSFEKWNIINRYMLLELARHTLNLFESNKGMVKEEVKEEEFEELAEPEDFVAGDCGKCYTKVWFKKVDDYDVLRDTDYKYYCPSCKAYVGEKHITFIEEEELNSGLRRLRSNFREEEECW